MPLLFILMPRRDPGYPVTDKIVAKVHPEQVVPFNISLGALGVGKVVIQVYK